MKKKFSLFSTAFLQVFFVTVCTYCIANGLILGALTASFCINWLWSANVKRAAFGDNVDRIFYALGGASGTGSGIILMIYL